MSAPERPPAVVRRLNELDQQIAAARPEYERTQARIQSSAYATEMLLALGKIAEIADVLKTERPDLHALVALGRIQQIAEPFVLDRVTLDRVDLLKSQRVKLDMERQF